ncbi:MAG: metallophosphoesterase [Alphaproteobacteria bacterium]|nr:metallophosphoesterase [Alphaproteobacteria bacterium]
MFTFAHLSDIHLDLAASPGKLELFNKRIIGYINLIRKRNNEHNYQALDAIVADINAHAPDHIVLTGDLINLALPSEYETARKWLMQFGSYEKISVVPGNHDTYLRRASQNGLLLLSSYMQDDNPSVPPLHWPYVRKRGPIALICLSSAISNSTLMATGRVGLQQRNRLAKLLCQLKEEKFFRVILIHHPPVPGTTKWYKRLIDAAALNRIICTYGAELILHGHNHTDTLNSLIGPGGSSIPVIGVPSASSMGHNHHPLAQYNLFTISGAPGAWRCELTARRLCTKTASIHVNHRQLLHNNTDCDRESV